MKAPYFRTDQRIEALMAEVALWLDTPFADHGRVRGAGVDCVQLAGLVLHRIGVLPSFDPPPYTLDGGMHLPESALCRWLEESGRFENVDGTLFMPGDVLCFAPARGVQIAHHAGVFLGTGNRQFVNAMPRYGVKVRKLAEPLWASLLRAVYRPMEEVES